MSAANDMGARLRRARESRAVSLRKVAQDVGVSPSLLSQIETGKAQPSVATLYALANLLAVSVDHLLGLDSGDRAVAHDVIPELQRAADNPVIELENGMKWERLATGTGGPADAMLVTFEPGGSSSLEGKMNQHSGFEYAYLLSGRLTFRLEFDSHQLSPGDSVHFDSSRPHLFANEGSVPAQGVWFVIGRRGIVLGDDEGAAASPPPAVEALHRIDAID